MEMKELLDRIIEAKGNADAFFYKRPVKARPNPPATVADLRRLDAFLASRKLKAPASYRSFLSVYNGIESLLSPEDSLFSVDEVIERTTNWYARFEDELPELVQFVIGGGDSPSFTAFDVTTSSAGEGYAVQDASGEGRGYRYENFKAFLTEFLANLEQTVREQEKDRRKLKKP